MRRKEERGKLQNPREGLTEWFGEMYDRYVNQVFTYVAARVYSRKDAERITALTFEKALRSLGERNPARTTFGIRLFRVAKGKVVDQWRGRGGRPPRIERFDVEWMFDERSINNKENLDWYVDFANRLRDLKPRRQDLVVLRYIVGVSPDQIARIEGSSENAVSTELMRALRSLAGTSKGSEGSGGTSTGLVLGGKSARKALEAVDGRSDEAPEKERDVILAEMVDAIDRRAPVEMPLDPLFRKRTRERLLDVASDMEAAGARQSRSTVAGRRAANRRRTVLTAAAAGAVVALAAVVILIVLLLPSSGPSATLTVSRGNVSIVEPGDRTTTAKSGDRITTGESIKTDSYSWASADLPGGTSCCLDSWSTVKVVELPKGAVKGKSIFSQEEGRTYNRTAGDAGASYQVKTVAASVESKGGSFVVESDGSGFLALAIEGQVEVQPPGGEPIAVPQGRAAVSGEGGVIQVVEPTAEMVADETAWLEWNFSRDREVDPAAVIDPVVESRVQEAVAGLVSGSTEGLVSVEELLSEQEQADRSEKPAAEPPAPPPPPPPSVAIVDSSVSESSVSLSWSVSDPPAGDAYTVVLRSASDADPTWPDQSYSESSDPSSGSFTDSDVAGGNTYYYRVVLISYGRQVASSGVIDAAVPGNVDISLGSDTSSGRIVLSWQISGNVDYSSVALCRSETNPDPVHGADLTIDFPWQDSGSYVDGSAIPGQTYYYRVCVLASDGAYVFSYSNPVSAVAP